MDVCDRLCDADLLSLQGETVQKTAVPDRILDGHDQARVFPRDDYGVGSKRFSPPFDRDLFQVERFAVEVVGDRYEPVVDHPLQTLCVGGP